jgi:hypothetical protein
VASPEIRGRRGKEGENCKRKERERERETIKKDTQRSQFFIIQAMSGNKSNKTLAMLFYDVVKLLVKKINLVK